MAPSARDLFFYYVFGERPLSSSDRWNASHTDLGNGIQVFQEHGLVGLIAPASGLGMILFGAGGALLLGWQPFSLEIGRDGSTTFVFATTILMFAGWILLLGLRKRRLIIDNRHGLITVEYFVGNLRIVQNKCPTECAVIRIDMPTKYAACVGVIVPAVNRRHAYFGLLNRPTREGAIAAVQRTDSISACRVTHHYHKWESQSQK